MNLIHQRQVRQVIDQRLVSDALSRFDLDNLAAVLTTPTERSATLVGEPFETRPKKASVNNGLMASYVPSQQYLTINEQFSRLSPDLSSDGDGGATNDADSILSFDSHKSNTMTSESLLFDPAELRVSGFRYARAGRWSI